jgi:hypothetical protein
MNDDQIERWLRMAPAVSVPAGLLGRLQADVRLPRGQARAVREFDSRPWLRRWLPAVSFAVFFLGCLVVIGVQTSVLSELKRENAELRSAGQNLEQLRADNAAYQRLLAQSRELERLRQDNADVKRLRGEVAQLRAQVKEAEDLRAGNQTLRTQNAATADAKTDFFAQEQELIERQQCCENLKYVGLAARTWSGDHGDVMPPDFISMKAEFGKQIEWRDLQCPSDKSRNVTGWGDVAAGNVSYLWPGAGAPETEPQDVLAYCPIHHNYLLVDGSVQMLSVTGMKAMIKEINGRMVLDSQR